MRIISLIMLCIMLLSLFIPCICKSDSGYFVISYNKLYFDPIPHQTGVILYRGGYEYLMVFTTYSVSSANTTAEALFYFPLPSKPLVVEITPLTHDFELEFSTDFRREELSSLPYGIIVSTAGGGGKELEVYASEYYNLSLVEAREADIGFFREILSSKGYHGELPQDFIKMINHYLELGWKYFVVGVVTVNGSLTLLQQYVFKTDKIIYPLYVDRLNKDKIEGSIFIVCDKIIEEHLDPLYNDVKSSGDLLYGLNLKMWFTGLDQNDYVALNRSLNRVFDDKLVQKIFNGSVKLSFGESIRVYMKGIVYYYEFYTYTSNIENDLIAYPGKTRDISFQVMGVPIRIVSFGLPGLFTPILLFLFAVLAVASGYEESVKTRRILSLSFIAYIGVIIYIHVMLLTLPLGIPWEYYASVVINRVLAIVFLALIASYYIILLNLGINYEGIIFSVLMTALLSIILDFLTSIPIAVFAVLAYNRVRDKLRPRHKYLLLSILSAIILFVLVMGVVAFGVLTIA